MAAVVRELGAGRCKGHQPVCRQRVRRQLCAHDCAHTAQAGSLSLQLIAAMLSRALLPCTALECWGDSGVSPGQVHGGELQVSPEHLDRTLFVPVVQ
jgi:hypothetical protein